VFFTNYSDFPFVNRYLEYKWDKSIINKRGEADLCNHTSLLMMRYNTVLYNILSTTAQNLKKKVYRSENQPLLITKNLIYAVGKNSQQLSSSGVYLTNCKNCVINIYKK
jgi:hypothetical protein